MRMMSNCEKVFLLQALREGKRLDGRQLNEFRKPKITFGSLYGCCHAELGKTRVLAQVSCELVTPRLTRESEGTLQVNLELSPMAHPDFDTGHSKIMDLTTEITRILERLLRDSQCVDMESLCVVTGEKVWGLSVDVHVLNHAGNIVDCAATACVAALAHFRRPDVTASGEEIVVWPAAERDPLPTTMLHLPSCVTLAICPGNVTVADPSLAEEAVAVGRVCSGLNILGEVCALQASGGLMTTPTELLQCVDMAGKHVGTITEAIKDALAKDRQKRNEKSKRMLSVDDVGLGFTQLFTDTEEATPEVTCEEKAEVAVSAAVPPRAHPGPGRSPMLPGKVRKVQKTGYPQTVQVGEGGRNTWLNDVPSSSTESDTDDDVMVVESTRNTAQVVTVDDDSDEEVIILESNMSTTQTQASKVPNTQNLNLGRALKLKDR